MNDIFFEALTYGGKEYRPLEEVELSAQQQIISGKGTAAEPLLVRISVTNSGTEEWHGILRLGISVPGKDEPFFLLPGFMVGTNRGDAPLIVDSKCARLRKGEANFPASPWWQVRSDRLSHPAALMYADGRVCGICGAVRFGDDENIQFSGFGCDIDKRGVYYTLGWENAPWLFIDSHTYAPREVTAAQCIGISPGAAEVRDIYVYSYEADELLDIHDAVQSVYGICHQKPRKGADIETGVRLLTEAIDEYAYLPEDNAYAGFVFDYGKGFEYRILPSISWTNGMSTAMPMLLASHRLKNEEMRCHALAFIQKIVDNSLNEASGLPWETYDGDRWSNHGWWFDKLPVPGHTGYISGQTAYGILKAYEAEKRFAGVEHEDWLKFAVSVVEHLNKTCNSDGEYPYVISEQTGAGLCYDSMSSAWCLAAAAYAAVLTDRRDGADALLRSEEHYYSHFVSQVCCYGGPMDIDKQIDSEGVLAYLRAVKCLHMLTGDDMLIKHMRDALLFEFTFKFCYNAPVQVPPLNNGWSSCGGSITSVTNPHIHPMSSSVMDELVYCLDRTGDGYIRSRLEDTVGWSLQTFNMYAGEYGYGLAGWMSERFCYSQGLLTERYPDGSPASTWFALMPWASGSIIEGLCGEVWERKV